MSTAKTDLLSRVFIPICKIDEENRLVYGKMTFEAEDSAGEIWDYEGSKPYFEAWSENAEKTSGGKSLGNLRSMHQPIAAGKLTQFLCSDEDKAVEIAAKVVDDAEWGKVLEGVYTGFSQGGRYVKRWKDPDQPTKTRFISDPVEVSLVDLPCLPGATFEYVKADGSVELRKFNTKETVMDPTNEEIEGRAKELAKAAGDEAKWTDHIDDARTALVAEKVAPVVEEPEVVVEEPAAVVEETVVPAEKAAEPEVVDEPTGEDEEAPIEDAATDISAEDAEKARKTARESLVQVWLTPAQQELLGKSAYVKAADAVTAIVGGEPETSPPSPVEAALAAAKGDVVEEPAAPEMVKFEPTPDLVVAKATLDTLVEKGLWTARSSLCVLQDVISLQSDASWEAEFEQDGSSVPAQLADIARRLGETALAMCQEEISEALAALPNAEEGMATIFVECADQGEFAKGILGSEDLMKAAVEKRAPAPVEDEVVDEDAEKALEAEELRKRAEKDPVVKHLLERTEKAEGEVEKALAGIADLGKTIETLKATPAPMAPRTSVVGKTHDTGGAEVDLTKAETLITELGKTQDGQRLLAEAAIRASQATGGVRS